MSWAKSLRCLTGRSNCNSVLCSWVRKHENSVLVIEKNFSLTLQSERGYTSATPLQQAAYGNKHFSEADSTRTMAQRIKLPSSVVEVLAPKQHTMTLSRQYSHSAENDPDLNRDFFVQLWVADGKKRRSRGKRKHRVHHFADNGETVYGEQASLQVPYGRGFSGTSVTGDRSYNDVKPVLKQPPTSQSVTGLLQPSSPQEAQLAPLLARSNLLISRDIEWANLVLGFEQENRYAIIDVCYPQTPVGFIREQSNVIARQLLRLRRPFMAYITDGLGNELFRVRRPFWWITSSIYAEINGKEIGVVHRRWHLWKRIYDLYLGNKQFAVVENPGFWNWTFTLKDIDGKVLAEIDRNWRGFGFEIFTDAGQYVIRFGEADSSSGSVSGIQELQVTRPLTLSERAVTVALAVSLDNDYFSRHGGWGIPFVVVGE